MVEMVETAAILNQATAHSLVILDEIGRGTATFDGLSIAWAVMEHLHDKNRARAIFATHFHELTHLSRKLPRLTNLTMRVTDWNGEVIFLHEILPGAADRSYGIQVAKLAGLPGAVVERAKLLLAELEAGDRHTPVERLVADLPLFAAKPEPPAPAPKPDPLGLALDALDPDALTPREALEALYRLKNLKIKPARILRSLRSSAAKAAAPDGFAIVMRLICDRGCPVSENRICMSAGSKSVLSFVFIACLLQADHQSHDKCRALQEAGLCLRTHTGSAIQLSSSCSI